MRALTGLLCAVAITACLAPGVRADEYTKQTFLTFSGPVQLPGITLPAGTYQFKLADPEAGRRTLQVWDKDGTKLYTTLLTIPDERMTPTDKPVVMFAEVPSGQAQAIRAWFYPSETFGQEFVYPKRQAMNIAKETHSSVLAFADDTKSDEAAYKSAKVERVDQNGNVTGNASTTTASSSTASSASTTTADTSHAPAAPSSTSQPAAMPSQTARADTAPSPSANRSGAPAVGTSGTTAPSAASTTSEANRDNMPSATGTAGTTANPVNSNRTAQAAAGANAAAPQSNRQLPRTASSTTLIELLAGLSLAAAFGLRVFRMRMSESR